MNKANEIEQENIPVNVQLEQIEKMIDDSDENVRKSGVEKLIKLGRAQEQIISNKVKLIMEECKSMSNTLSETCLHETNFFAQLRLNSNKIIHLLLQVMMRDLLDLNDCKLIVEALKQSTKSLRVLSPISPENPLDLDESDDSSIIPHLSDIDTEISYEFQGLNEDNTDNEEDSSDFVIKMM